MTSCNHFARFRRDFPTEGYAGAVRLIWVVSQMGRWCESCASFPVSGIRPDLQSDRITLLQQAH